MMKYFLATALLASLPIVASAQDRMTKAACQEAYVRAADLVNPDDPNVDVQAKYARVTSDGWCQFRGIDPGFEDMPFDTIDWRIEGTSRWVRDGIPPTALELRISGLEPAEIQGGGVNSAPPLTIEATVRQDPQAGVLIVERAVMTNDAGDILSVSGVYERVFLTSPSMIQVSIGSAAFKAGLVSMTLEGTHDNPFGLFGDITGTPAFPSDVVFESFSRLPDGLIDDASLAALTSFVDDLPQSVGTLELVVASERGLGIMQFGAAMVSSLGTNVFDEAIVDTFEILFDGLTLTANWSPAAQPAD